MYTLITLLFIAGYAAIAFEHPLKINKTASALLTGVLCWVVYIMGSANTDLVSEQLYGHLGQISGILFFLLSAMTIVELIDAHDGFEVITSKITTKDKRKLLWIIGFVTFFLSSVLDNLTTTIVMVSLLRKLISDKQTRMFFIGIVVIAANAGGAWTPIGDVTTTMLWIGGQITTGNIMMKLFLPSMACLIVPLILLSFSIKGKIENAVIDETRHSNPTTTFERKLILALGIGALIFVPVFKTITHLPPFLGILFGLGVLWVVTEMIHKNKNDADKDVYSVVHALRKADTPSVLFFLGILVAISALESTHLLTNLATYMDSTIGNINIIVISIGLLSAIIDNVPLVAATMGMYDMQTYPTDHYFWEFIAYCAGTGGSCLIIGSAAGVAAMGMEKIDFFWYVKKISLLALLGYFAGALIYMAQHYFFHF
ncbi:MAG TPA: sodium:proton antiporter NhaD [Flavitalea sp.]|nr:sodium:proton antiporter NhaD [Flavitalea sp.]HTF28990.1 sodium:proton antiporter NhaD [Flavitalea sp.]